MIHYGWAILAALAGVIFGALLMSLMAVASYADRVEELIQGDVRDGPC